MCRAMVKMKIKTTTQSLNGLLVYFKNTLNGGIMLPAVVGVLSFNQTKVHLVKSKFPPLGNKSPSDHKNMKKKKFLLLKQPENTRDLILFTTQDTLNFVLNCIFKKLHI